MVLLLGPEFDGGVRFSLDLLDAIEENSIMALDCVDAVFVQLNSFSVVNGHASTNAYFRVEDSVEAAVTPLAGF